MANNNNNNNNNPKGIVATIIAVIIILSLFMACTGSCSSSKRYSNSDREIEKVRDQLYKKGSDGKWYKK